MTFEEMVDKAIKIKNGLIKPMKNELIFGNNNIDKISIAKKRIDEIKAMLKLK